jgi:seryl-tRNA synthetase
MAASNVTTLVQQMAEARKAVEQALKKTDTKEHTLNEKISSIEDQLHKAKNQLQEVLQEKNDLTAALGGSAPTVSSDDGHDEIIVEDEPSSDHEDAHQESSSKPIVEDHSQDPANDDLDDFDNIDPQQPSSDASSDTATPTPKASSTAYVAEDDEDDEFI